MKHLTKLITLCTLIMLASHSTSFGQFGLSIGWGSMYSDKYTQYLRLTDSYKGAGGNTITDSFAIKDVLWQKANLGCAINVKVGFARFRNSSLAFGIPLAVGVGKGGTTYGSTFVTLDWNFGFMKDRIDLMQDKYGFFVGVGYGGVFTSTETESESSYIDKSLVPNTDNATQWTSINKYASGYHTRSDFVPGQSFAYLSNENYFPPSRKAFFSPFRPMIHAGFAYDLIGIFPPMIRVFYCPSFKNNASYYGINFCIDFKSESLFD